MVLNRQLLEDKLLESGYKMSFISEKLGISPQAFIKKRNGELPFKISDVETLLNLCNWDAETIYSIFFAQKFS